MKDTEQPVLIKIGTITAPHGIQGEMKLYSLTVFPERFQDLDRVYLKKGTDQRIYHLQKTRITARDILISFRECQDRDMATALMGYSIYIPAEERYILPKGYYYHDDLIAMDVYESNGSYIGKVESIYERGSQDCLNVLTNEGKIVLIPFHKEFVKELNLMEKKIFIQVIPGLLGE